MPDGVDLPTHRGPLAGVRVVEIATVLAGPGCGRYLADFGAEVVKIERPPGGDPSRRMGWSMPDDPESMFWRIANRNKRTIVLDLKVEADLARALDLILSADILIENMRPGKLEALGLGPEVLLDRNPKLVVVRVTGFGQTGPYAQRPGFATIAEALSGFAEISGEADGPPLLPPIALTDEVTGIVAAMGAMLALRHAEQSGHGQVVDVSLFESMLQLMGPLPAAFDSLGYLQPRMGAGIPYTTPRGTYQCSDGSWIALSATSDSVAGRLMTVLGLGEDERFDTFRNRELNREELEAHVAAWVAARSQQEVIDMLTDADAAVAPVYSMRDIVADPHVQSRQSLVRVDGILMQGPIVGLSVTPGEIRWAGPDLPAVEQAT